MKPIEQKDMAHAGRHEYFQLQSQIVNPVNPAMTEMPSAPRQQPMVSAPNMQVPQYQ